MRVIGFVSQKGGSGKTTLSGHIAVQAERMGAGPVAIIDTDPQGSLAAWWNARQGNTPAFVNTSLADLREHLGQLREAGFKLVIIDSPPAITPAIYEVVSVCDQIVVPTRPSPHDLRAVAATVELVQQCRKPLVFVVNDATPRARITSDAAVALSQHGTVAPVTLHHRVDFASAMIDGRTVMELDDNSRSAKEVAALWTYIETRLANLVSRAVFHIDEHPRFDAKPATAEVPVPAFDPVVEQEVLAAEAMAADPELAESHGEVWYRADDVEKKDPQPERRRFPRTPEMEEAWFKQQQKLAAPRVFGRRRAI